MKLRYMYMYADADNHNWQNDWMGCSLKSRVRVNMDKRLECQESCDIVSISYTCLVIMPQPGT